MLLPEHGHCPSLCPRRPARKEGDTLGSPDLIGNDYFVLGTVRLKAWKDGLQGKKDDLDQMMEHVSDFKENLKLEMDPGGWVPAGKIRKSRSIR